MRPEEENSLISNINEFSPEIYNLCTAIGVVSLNALFIDNPLISNMIF